MLPIFLAQLCVGLFFYQILINWKIQGPTKNSFLVKKNIGKKMLVKKMFSQLFFLVKINVLAMIKKTKKEAQEQMLPFKLFVAHLALI